MPQATHRFTRYLVVEVVVEISGDTDQNLADHEDEISDEVEGNLNFKLHFNDMVTAGSSTENSIEVPVKIVESEILDLLDYNPIL